jgi:hypothetical protein
MKTKKTKSKTKKTKSKRIERVGTYWICYDCVIEKHPDWELPGWPVTVTKGLCGHCDRKDEAFLTPIVDFKRPGHTEVWD